MAILNISQLSPALFLVRSWYSVRSTDKVNLKTAKICYRMKNKIKIRKKDRFNHYRPEIILQTLSIKHCMYARA